MCYNVNILDCICGGAMVKDSEFIGLIQEKEGSSFYPDFYQIYAKKNIVILYANKSFPFKRVPKIIKKGTIGGWVNKETNITGISWVEKNTLCKNCSIDNSYIESQKTVFNSTFHDCIVVSNQVVRSSISKSIVFGVADNVSGHDIAIDKNSIAYGSDNTIFLQNVNLINHTTLMAIENISIKGNKNKITIDSGDIRRQDDISSVIEKDVLVVSYKALLGGNERRFFVSNSGVFEDRDYDFMCSNVSIFELIKSFLEERGCISPENKLIYSIDKNKNAVLEYLVSEKCRERFSKETDINTKTNILLKAISFILSLDSDTAQNICNNSCIDIVSKKIVKISQEFQPVIF